MSAQERTALALTGAGFGSCTYANDTLDDSSSEQDAELFKFSIQYALLAASMVEAAYGVTFAYPEDHEYSIYYNLGDWLGDQVSWNVDGWNYPDHDDVVEYLIDSVYNDFHSVAVETQYDTLRNAITQAAENTA